MAESSLSHEQINNIVNDLLSMNYDEALLRLGGMQIIQSDREMILAIYKSRVANQSQFRKVSDDEAGDTSMPLDKIESLVAELLKLSPPIAYKAINELKVSDIDKAHISDLYKYKLASRGESFPKENTCYNPPKNMTGQAKEPKLTALRVLLVVSFIVLAIVFSSFSRIFYPKTPSPPALPSAVATLSPLPTLDQSLATEVPTPAPSTFNHPFKTAPLNGDLINYTHEKAVAPFEITLPQTEEFYCIIMKKVSNPGAITVSIFMNPKESHEFSVPFGTYDVYVASGTQWYGYDYLFGPDGTYGKLDSTFEFSQDDDYATGHSIELMSTYNGNLDTDPMSYEDFIE